MLRFARFELFLKRLPLFTLKRPTQKVFYPGCSLAAHSPETVRRLYSHLCHHDPEIGFWFDCCGMPLEKFDSPRYAQPWRTVIADELSRAGISEIITACGNCFTHLRTILPETIRVTPVYSWLADHPVTHPPAVFDAIHHPCPGRTDSVFKHSFFTLLDTHSITLPREERETNRLACCLVNTEKARRRITDNAPIRFITYCGHCASRLSSRLSITHVLAVLFDAPSTIPRGMAGRFLNYRSLKKRFGP